MHGDTGFLQCGYHELPGLNRDLAWCLIHLDDSPVWPNGLARAARSGQAAQQQEFWRRARCAGWIKAPGQGDKAPARASH